MSVRVENCRSGGVTTTREQHQTPTVVIVQRPVIVRNSPIFNKPYLRRGVKLNNGKQIGGNVIYTLGIAGGFLFFLGFVFAIVGISVFGGILLLLIGGLMLAACLKFCHKAKQDYDSLPQDHPDRITYTSLPDDPNSTGAGNFAINSATTTYQIPAGAQVITPTGHGNQYVAHLQLPIGQHPMNVPMLQPVQPSSSHGTNIHQYPGNVSIPPADDKPPSYEDVCKDMNYPVKQ